MGAPVALYEALFCGTRGGANDGRRVCVVDLVAGDPPFSPASVIEEYAAVVRRYQPPCGDG